MDFKVGVAEMWVAGLAVALAAGCLLQLSQNRRLAARLARQQEEIDGLNQALAAEQARAAQTEQAAAAFRGSAKLLSLAADLAQLAPWRFDHETGLFEFDDKFYAIYGTDVATEGTSMTLAEYITRFVHPEDAPLVAGASQKMAAAPKQGCFIDLDHRVIRRDGEVRTVYVRVAVEIDAAGNMVRTFGVNQDITERKAVELALSNSREMLSLASQLAHIGPWKFHPDQGLFEFSDEFYAIFKTDVATEGACMTVREYCRRFVHPDYVWIFAGGDPEKRYEHRVICKDGEERIVEVQGKIVRDADGNIVNWYGVQQDITERKLAEAAVRAHTEEIRRIAYTDALTGLANRVHLNEWLEDELKQARRGETAGSVLYIDLDDLQTVNDTLGHTYGDALIFETAERIRRQIGDRGFVGRIGGDEFVVILPQIVERDYIAAIADQFILAMVQEFAVLGETFHLSASIGVALYPDDGDTVEEILKNVDNAMYYAKNAGKNCWKYFDTNMRAAVYEKMLLTKSLRQAVDNGEFALHYQPQIDIRTGAVVGFEALLRWNSPEHGEVPPVRFIPIAEQTGLIKSIGAWVIRESCWFARRLADGGWGHLRVAINISPHQLCSEQFIETVREALKQAEIAPSRLEVEITENVLIASLNEAFFRLDALRAMGVRLALDDFGTGYSSLTYLRRLPVHTLKIDKAFTDMILEDQPKRSMIHSIVEMAHQLEMSVVAEGVETQEQLSFLAASRCDVAQGYLFSRPVPEPEALRLLAVP